MVVAYLFALVFAIAYGHTAATNKRASAALLPLLDVLQSIPILGFFPAALIFFVATFHGHPIGIEFAVVFLIFTSMAWNMAFGVYESLTTIPADLEAAAASFGLRGWLRFRYLAFPAAIPKLVYNSILSWTNGWFFLVASEIFSAGGTEFQRPGLGAFIAVAGRNGDIPSIAIGIAVLAAVVLTLDIFVWRPLGAWPERPRPLLYTAPRRSRAGVGVHHPLGRDARRMPEGRALPVPGPRAVRFPPGDRTAPGHRGVRAPPRAVGRSRGPARGDPDRTLQHAVVPPVQPHRRRPQHPGRPEGGGPVVRPPRTRLLAAAIAARACAVPPHGEHHGLGGRMERPHRVGVHPIRPPVLRCPRPRVPPEPRGLSDTGQRDAAPHDPDDDRRRPGDEQAPVAPPVPPGELPIPTRGVSRGRSPAVAGQGRRQVVLREREGGQRPRPVLTV